MAPLIPQPVGSPINRYCIWCEKAFPSKAFAAHYKSRHGTNTVECAICMNRFRKGGLAPHQQIGHTGLVPNGLLTLLIKNDLVLLTPAAKEKKRDGAGPSSK